MCRQGRLQVVGACRSKPAMIQKKPFISGRLRATPTVTSFTLQTATPPAPL